MPSIDDLVFVILALAGLAGASVVAWLAVKLLRSRSGHRPVPVYVPKARRTVDALDTGSSEDLGSGLDDEPSGAPRPHEESTVVLRPDGGRPGGRSESVKARLEDGEPVLIVPDFRNGKPLGEPAIYFPTPETERGLVAKIGENDDSDATARIESPPGASEDKLEPPAPEDEECLAERPKKRKKRRKKSGKASKASKKDALDATRPGLDAGVAYAYEAKCPDCGLKWRLPGLWTKAPLSKFRCPLCRGYKATFHPVYRVRGPGPGGAAILLASCLLLDGCGRAPSGVTKTDVADLGSGSSVSSVTSDSTASPPPAPATQAAFFQGEPAASVAEPAPFARSSPRELIDSFASALDARDLGALARMRIPPSKKAVLDEDDLARARRDFQDNGRDAYWRRVLSSLGPGSISADGGTASYRASVGGSLGSQQVVLERTSGEWVLRRP